MKDYVGMISPIEKLMNTVAWEPVNNLDHEINDGLPYVTHTGVFGFGVTEFKCYQLNNGRSVLDAEDVKKFFGHVPKGWINLCLAI